MTKSGRSRRNSVEDSAAVGQRRDSIGSLSSAVAAIVDGNTIAPILDRATNNSRPPSLLKHILTKNGTTGDVHGRLEHDGNNASIVTEEIVSPETPWTPRSLVRAKSAIIYKQTLNDTLLILERNIFFFSDWVSYFVSLQEDCMLLFKSREKWEQGLNPDKIIGLNPTMMLGEMKVDVVSSDGSNYDASVNTSVRLFRRKLVETDQLDQWLNEELRQSLVIDSGSVVDGVLLNNPIASSRCVVEFASYSQSTFELWSKTLRRILQLKRDRYSVEFNVSSARTDTDAADNNNTSSSPARSTSKCKTWVSPGHDSKLTLHQSEIWCNRVISGEKEKAESELRRIIAMEKLVAQVTSPRMALLVYEKVSRVHELFVANCRREIERIDGRKTPISADVLNFFADHLKRKYSVFLILALAYGVGEEQIREAHEAMCEENAAVNAGVGGGVAEQNRTASCYGFEDAESVELYEKYRDAAINYHKMNYGDTEAAEEEDAIMHLPVMLQVSVIRQDEEEAKAMLSILDNVKARLVECCTDGDNNSS